MSIIGGVITFASTFFEIFQFFTNFPIFWQFAVQALPTSAFFASSGRFERLTDSRDNLEAEIWPTGLRNRYSAKFRDCY